MAPTLSVPWLSAPVGLQEAFLGLLSPITRKWSSGSVGMFQTLGILLTVKH